MFVPARRYVAAAEFSRAGYGDRIRIDADDGLHVGVDVADKATIAYICARVADSNDVVGRCDIAAGKGSQRNIVGAGGVAKERLKTVGRVVAAGSVAKAILLRW